MGSSRQRVGEEVGPWRILGRLGRGMMGTVYLAEDTAGQRVALKVLDGELALEPRLLERFERESRMLASLDHPNVVGGRGELLEVDGGCAFAMDLVIGYSLKDVLRQQGRLPAARALHLMDGVLAGLEAAHARGIVHRDLKPSNILLDRDDRPHVADFGLARAGDRSALTTTGEVLGTPAYMAPEQAEGQPALPASDLYATGCILFEMVTGRTPFEGANPLSVLRQHADAPPPELAALRPDLPTALGRAVARALAKDPAARFASAAAMRRVLAGITLDPSAEVPPVAASTLPGALPPPVPGSAPPRPRRRLALVLVAVTVLLAALSVPLWWGGNGEPGPAAVPEQPAPAPPPTHRLELLDGTAREVHLLRIDAKGVHIASTDGTEEVLDPAAIQGLKPLRSE